jgi:Pyruvate/2-oxoacid:ferredoxin oxidoreductase gamma subunit
MASLREALRSRDTGLKVIIADGEMPARASAARQTGDRATSGCRQAGGSHALLGGSEVCTGDHFLHPPVGLSVADAQAKRRTAAHRPGGARQQRLRRLRLVRRDRAAAQLCPSFAQIDIIRNPTLWDRLPAPLGRPDRPAGWTTCARSRLRPRSDLGEPARASQVLIAALGGEGGGVLSSWMHKAAIASGHFVQGTFIPGVAQRTGATTYYLEVVPGAGHHHGRGGGRPVLALNAVPGEVDLVVASEFMEAGRAIQAGFVTPERTVLIASSARVFTVEEKTAMGDGRFDAERLRQLAQRFARQAVVVDLAATASAVQAPLSAVLLGAIAASGVLPVSADAFPRGHPQRGQGGRGEPARLRGGDQGRGRGRGRCRGGAA